mmetsp:Transcript_82438/g.223387  ORF Transcript_82438/g.223387 Transcript_82438/m.223387 type:complete len:346 (-) Transcript_82438:144-1181(-)
MLDGQVPRVGRLLRFSQVGLGLNERVVADLHAQHVRQPPRQRHFHVNVQEEDNECAVLSRLSVLPQWNANADRLLDDAADDILLGWGDNELEVLPRSWCMPPVQAIPCLVVYMRDVLNQELAGLEEWGPERVVGDDFERTLFLEDFGLLHAPHPVLVQGHLLADRAILRERALLHARDADRDRVRAGLWLCPDVDVVCLLLRRPALVVEEGQHVVVDELHVLHQRLVRCGALHFGQEFLLALGLEPPHQLVHLALRGEESVLLQPHPAGRFENGLRLCGKLAEHLVVGELLERLRGKLRHYWLRRGRRVSGDLVDKAGRHASRQAGQRVAQTSHKVEARQAAKCR